MQRIVSLESVKFLHNKFKTRKLSHPFDVA